MLKIYNEFDRNPDLLGQFDKVLECYSATAVFADVQHRLGVMDSGIKPAFRAKVTGQAITVQLSIGDLVDPLKALEMGQAGDDIVVDAGGDPNTSVCGGLMGGLAKNRGIRGMIADGAGRGTDELEDTGDFIVADLMSGEIFKALCGHTILGTLMNESPFSEDGFREGVAAGLEAGPKLLHTLFHVRTMPLFGKIAEDKVADYLSGMLIGAEIHGATSNRVVDDPVTIIGRDDLADRYAIALQVLGQRSVSAPDDIVALGHFAIATSAGLLT